MMFLGGLAVGYLLGTRAGRQRYEQIAETAKKVWESPTVQEAAGVVQAQASKLYSDGKQKVNDTLHRIGGESDTAADVSEAAEEAAGAANSRRTLPANSF